MALVKCKECGNEVATSAKACPKCGNKMPKKTGLLTWIVGIFFALVVIGMVNGSLENQEREEYRQQVEAVKRQAEAEEAKRVAAMPPEERAAHEKALAGKKAAEALAERKAQGLAWNYRESKDAMAGKPVRTAEVLSANQVNFDFPYQGAQRARLQLRAHPRFGNDAILYIDKGQFTCNTQDCSVQVRFDEGGTNEYSMSEPDDNSSNILFFSNYDRFLANVRRSKRVRIEAGFFQEGNRVFEFHVDGLEWK
jgi:hypothetical protein